MDGKNTVCKPHMRGRILCWIPQVTKKKERQPKSSRLPHPKAQNRRRAACTSWLFRDVARLTTHAAMQFARLTYQERTSKEFYM